MSGDLHARLKQEAANEGLSLNKVCIARLQASQSLLANLGANAAAENLIIPEFPSAILRQWSDELVGLVLFGSAARGDATENSDVDLLLVMKPEVKIVRDFYRLWDAFCDKHIATRDCNRISPHFVNLPGSVQEAGGLWYEIAIDGMVLWESDRKVSRFLRTVRAAMGQGKIRRRMVYGSPYWIKEF